MTDVARSPRPRPQRSDGEQTRERLMHAALRLFAQHGFEKTSTREIAEAAGTNLAAIKYYFGDKAGLYRTVFFEMQGKPEDEIERYADPSLSLAEALLGFYTGFVEPLREGDVAQQCIKLHAREILEPTGLWQQEISEGIQPMHEALLAVLARHLGVATPDDELRRLAMCLAGLGVHLHICTDVIDVVAPALKQGAQAWDRWLDRLVMYGLAMVEAERQRRATPEPSGETPR
ncbi:CerR family C-terminal domain-containing protein [Piscinibacter defluvii]|uniref:CerR family C-terminal domain-containing protein n=1 Tax=Piscinibacter defluvii TaxID=1796922 RepID=UPI000FDDB530|nr:CerR family C-terminal domain-containing protein [Piscinibacter defluvii]